RDQDRPAPQVPGRRPRPLRRPAARPLGGRAGHLGRGGHAGRRDQGQGAGRHVERQAAPAPRPRPAASPRQPGRPVRRGQDHGAGQALARGTSAPRAAGRDLDVRSQEAIVTYALVRPVRLDLEAFARATATPPDLIPRLVARGVVEADRDAAGRLWFGPEQVAVVARVQRLRAGFALNYAAVGLVIDLLDRITALEAALRSAGPGGRTPQTPPRSAGPGAGTAPPGTTGQPGGRTWTRTT